MKQQISANCACSSLGVCVLYPVPIQTSAGAAKEITRRKVLGASIVLPPVGILMNVLDNFIYQTVINGLLGSHKVVTVCVFFYNIFWLAGVTS